MGMVYRGETSTIRAIVVLTRLIQPGRRCRSSDVVTFVRVACRCNTTGLLVLALLCTV